MAAPPAPRPWWYRLLWALHGTNGRRTLLEGDVAGAHAAYIAAVADWLAADCDWYCFEAAAARGGDPGAIPGDPDVLLATLDATFEHWKRTWELAAGAGAQPGDVPVPHDTHLDAATRCAPDTARRPR